MILIKHTLIRETSLKWNSSAKFHEGLDFYEEGKRFVQEKREAFPNRRQSTEAKQGTVRRVKWKWCKEVGKKTQSVRVCTFFSIILLFWVFSIWGLVLLVFSFLRLKVNITLFPHIHTHDPLVTNVSSLLSMIPTILYASRHVYEWILYIYIHVFFPQNRYCSVPCTFST